MTNTEQIPSLDISLDQLKKNNAVRAWFICLTGSLLFFYEFIQINIMNSLNPFLARDLHLSAISISTISSVYFIANVLLLFVAGMLLDRYSTKLLIIFAMLSCSVGTLIFSFAHSMPIFLLSRLLMGAGGAFCFLGAFRLATRWFPPNKLSFATGIIVTMGMLGGLVGQQPAVLLIQAYGWRHTVLLDAILGFAFVILMVIIIKDSPSKQHVIIQKLRAQNIGVKSLISKVLSQWQIWCGALYGASLNLVIFVIGALWGTRYLIQTYHVNVLLASHISSCMLIGSILGSPIVGYIFDRITHKKILMFICATLSLFSLLLLFAFNIKMNIASLCAIFFSLGFFTSIQVIAYPHAARQTIPALQASATSIVSTCMLLLTAIMQPLFAYFLKLNSSTNLHHQMHYNYNYALTALAIALCLSIVLSLFMKINTQKDKSYLDE